MSLPDTLDKSSSLLFLGSGFSAEATNIANKNPPTGKGLAEEFERQLGINHGELDLKVLANEMQFRSDLNLYQTLYNLFTIAGLTDDQLEILSHKWLRVFTTNYDDGVELGYQKNRIRCPSVNYDDPIPRRIPIGTIVHIHGTIRKASDSNVLDQLVLNENSYIRQHFEESPWYAELDRALDHCSSCFFVGYSLSDYHIAALLLQKPNRKTKTFFITKHAPNDIARRQLEQFGEIHPIGISGFANLCRTLPAPPPITDLRTLRSVKYLDPFRDHRAILPPTSSEILRLVTFGDFNPQRCLTNLPAANYVVPREEIAISAVTDLKRGKTLIVHSFLGNGKTIFIPILAYQLSIEGYKSFVCNSAGPETSIEISALQNQDKVVIFFDSYDLAIIMVPVFEDLLPQAKYVVNVRTGVQEIRLHEIQEKMPHPVFRISLNGIKRNEKVIFRDLLDAAGLLGSKLAEMIDGGNDYREIVTTVYNHEGIRSQLASAIKPLLADEHSKSVLITGLLLSWIGQKFEPALFRAVTKRDPYVELRRHEAIASEIFKLDENDLEVRSPLFAEYVLRTHCAPDDLLAIIEKLVVVAVRRKRERGFQGILSKLMRVAVLKTIIVGAKGLQTIEDMFQSLQRDIEVNDEPLFWLQYAILESEMKNFSEAEKFLETAYKRAEKSALVFETFQIDTYALRLLLHIEELSTSKDVTRFEQILQKSELVLSMINDQNRRFHAIQVLEGFEPFVKARAATMTISERNAMIFQLGRLEQGLDGLTPEVRAETGSDIIKRSLSAAREYIVTLR